MNFDEHWQTSPPGPIASQDWYVENLRQIGEVVPPTKLIVAVGSCAYDWSEGAQKTHEPAQPLTMQEALLHAFESEAQVVGNAPADPLHGIVEFDSRSLNPHYSYYDEHNHVHQVWMLDAVTAYNELRASERLGLRGTALWRLGSADTSLWPIWDATRPNDAIRQKIEDLPPGPDPILEGDGDVWHFLDTPKRGRRSISYDSSSDLITNEKYEAYPLSYRIDQIGAAKKKLAITFDDGPDWKWTPKILDVLKEKNVPATFFVIGLSANKWPQLLRREYAEGHEIGNHTYSHPDWENPNLPKKWRIFRPRRRWATSSSARRWTPTTGSGSVRAFRCPPQPSSRTPLARRLRATSFFFMMAAGIAARRSSRSRSLSMLSVPRDMSLPPFLNLSAKRAPRSCFRFHRRNNSRRAPTASSSAFITGFGWPSPPRLFSESSSLAAARWSLASWRSSRNCGRTAPRCPRRCPALPC